jgi:heptosyltransferase-3
LETEERTYFLKKRNKKLLIPVGVGYGGAKRFRESKFFCFFLFTKRSAFFAFDVFFRILGNYSSLVKSLGCNITRLYRLRRDGAAMTAIILTGRLGDIIAAHAVLPALAAPGKRLIWLARPGYVGLLADNPALHAALPVTSYTEARLLRLLFRNTDFLDLHVDKSVCETFKFSVRNPNRHGIALDNFYHFGTLSDVYCLIATGKPASARPRIVCDPDFDTPPYFSAPEKPVLAFHTVSEEAQRSWPAAQSKALAAHILSDTDFNICGFGRTPQLIQGPRIATPGDSLTLPQQAALMARCRVFIGVDSAFAHMANAFAVPSILLLGDYRNFTTHLPWHLHRRDILLRTAGDAANIPPERVIAALNDFLKDIV